MPTLKQKTVAQNLVENGGKSISKAMVEAGYSKATANTPQKLTNSKGWVELMEEYLPDIDLQRVHREGLEATKTIFVEKTSGTFINVPDYLIRQHYLELAYKIKGKYTKNINLTDIQVEFQSTVIDTNEVEEFIRFRENKRKNELMSN